jgi:hypothetical protein
VHYHRHARDCIALTLKSNDEMQRAQLFAMAEAWTKLAWVSTNTSEWFATLVVLNVARTADVAAEGGYRVGFRLGLFRRFSPASLA